MEPTQPASEGAPSSYGRPHLQVANHVPLPPAPELQPGAATAAGVDGHLTQTSPVSYLRTVM